ncbi:hypothetical protein F4802DRAFT_2483 [Xylaria palmicola]|nr:hypothetical protein F4802DRAFT_2483 [Xylaria palmicola]
MSSTTDSDDLAHDEGAPPRPTSEAFTRCSHPKVRPVMEEIDANADINLIVGAPKCTAHDCDNEAQNIRKDRICFRVNSAILGRASPALGFTFYSPREEVFPPEDDPTGWTAHLPDDDPEAMRTIIHILYGRYPLPPQDTYMDLDALLNLTVLAEKYDLVHLFQPWSVQWMRDMEPYWLDRSFMEESTEDLESLLWIYWVLGHEPMYAYTVLQITMHCGQDIDWDLKDPTDHLAFTQGSRVAPQTPCAKLDVCTVRNKLFKVIMENIKQTLGDHLCGKPRQDGVRCRRSDHVDDGGWRRSVYRSLEILLLEEMIWPVPPAIAVLASPREMVETFRAHPNIPAFAHRGSAPFCEPVGPFWEWIEGQIQTATFHLRVPDAGYLSRQAAKSGLASYLASKRTRHRPDKGHWNLIEVLQFMEDIVKSECTAARNHHTGYDIARMS